MIDTHSLVIALSIYSLVFSQLYESLQGRFGLFFGYVYVLLQLNSMLFGSHFFLVLPPLHLDIVLS